MADEEQAVLEAFQALIKDADLDSLSERAIRKQLAEDLGIDITPYKELIAGEIEKLLQSLTPAEKKRKAEEEHAPGTRKVARVTNETPGEVDLGGRKKVVVRAFKGKTLVDIREYYEDKTSGEMKPGKKGIALSPSDFAVLAGNVEAITSALDEGNEDFSQPLSEKVKVAIFKGKFVDIREWYDKNGEKAPGAKGCALTKEQWGTLCNSIEVIKEDIKALPTSSAPGTSASVKPGSGKKPTSATIESADAGHEGQLPIMLSTNRRADISLFKGRTFVNIREYYEKDGAMLPGKKGISLTPDQFHQLRDEASSVSAALKASDAGFELDLSDKRKVKIFRGMVDIREYYEKEGEQRPGAKGISLPLAQWEMLSGNFKLLTEALESETEA